MNNYCIHYVMGVTQRINELRRGDGLEGSTGWEDKGCFDCRGDEDKRCDGYHENTFLEFKYKPRTQSD
jgi:hypothetical protein